MTFLAGIALGTTIIGIPIGLVIAGLLSAARTEPPSITGAHQAHQVRRIPFDQDDVAS